MAHFLCLWCFINQKEEEVSEKEFLASKYKNWSHHRIKELSNRWLLPVYSLDRVLLVYYLFWSMAYFLYLWHFNNQEEMEASVKESFIRTGSKN